MLKQWRKNTYKDVSHKKHQTLRLAASITVGITHKKSLRNAGLFIYFVITVSCYTATITSLLFSQQLFQLCLQIGATQVFANNFTVRVN